MKTLSVLSICVLLAIAPAPAFAQKQQRVGVPDWVSHDTQAVADVAIEQQKATLARQVVAGREGPIRELEPHYRAALVAQLQKEPLDKLQAYAAGLTPETNVIGDSSKDLVYVPLSAPCRVLDTRSTGAGAFAAGETRNYFVALGNLSAQGGNPAGCGIPFGPATAVNLNFVSVSAGGNGNLRGSAYGTAIPAQGSILNYQALTPALNIANAVVFPMCDPAVTNCSAADISILANASGTHLVIDVLGYFERFPKEQARTFTVTSHIQTHLEITATCTNYTSITLNAPVDGTVVLHGNIGVGVAHASGTADWAILNVAADAVTCDTTATQYGLSNYAFIDSAEPSSSSGSFPIVPIMATFPVTAGSQTFYVNGFKVGGGFMEFYNGGIDATFHPN